MRKLSFQNGIKDGAPIGLAYLVISFTFGLTAVQNLQTGIATLISATNVTSAGQFAGLKMLVAGAFFVEVFLAVVIINSRYLLMSLSITQFMGENVPTWQRLLMGCFVTDEIFAVANYRQAGFSFPYFMGLATLPYGGWVLGTLLGELINGALPTSLQGAMGIALYCMFIAIIIPPAKKSRPILCCIGISVAVACLLYFVPAFKQTSFGVQIIISSVTGATICALLFPIPCEEEAK